MDLLLHQDCRYQEDWPKVTLHTGTCATGDWGRSTYFYVKLQFHYRKTSYSWTAYTQKCPGTILAGKTCSEDPGEGLWLLHNAKAEWRALIFSVTPQCKGDTGRGAKVCSAPCLIHWFCKWANELIYHFLSNLHEASGWISSQDILLQTAARSRE